LFLGVIMSVELAHGIYLRNSHSNDMDGLSGRIFDSNVDLWGTAGQREEKLGAQRRRKGGKIRNKSV
jgi:hypothetical protein